MIECYWLSLCFDAMLGYIPEDYYTVDETTKFQNIATHIETIGMFLNHNDSTSDRIAQYFSLAGIGFKEISNYERALDYYFKSVSIRLRSGHEEMLGLVYNNISVIYNIEARYELAFRYSIKSIELCEKYGATPTELIISYNNLAVIYLQSSDINSAILWNTKALKLMESESLTENPLCSVAYFTRASICYTNEEFEKALDMDNKALLILKSNYPEEHVDIGSGYNNLAREYYSLKKYGIALEYYLKAHQIYEHVYGERHSFTAEVSGNISKTFMELNDYESALTWCLAALHTQKETLGEEHPEVILRHSFVSEIYEHLGLLDKAIIHLQIIRGYYKRLERNDILQIVDDRIRHNRQSLEAIYNEHL